jgi:glucose/arabinose dehydrogenase
MARSIRIVCIAFAVFLLTASTSRNSHAFTSAQLFSEFSASGYSIELFANIQWPAEIQCANDNRCFVASVHDPTDEERSAIWVVRPDGTKQRIYRGPSYDPTLLGEKGLTGMALHPRFDQDDRIFFYWTPPNHSRSEPTYSVISSIRSDGSDYHELWSFTPGGFTDSHVAGGLVTYSENGHAYLLVAIGEYGAGGSQDLTVTQGKIHRFEIVGDSLQAPTDNPFYNTPNAVQSIWASGFRNPFRLTRDSATGEVYIDENGFRCSDRVYRLVKGGNYGWPNWDWCQDDPEFVQPIYEFRPTIGITDIDVYHGPLSNWDGKVFICGFDSAPLMMFTLAENGMLINRQDVAANCMLALATRPDGALLFSRQSDVGEVIIIKPLIPAPRLTATLTPDPIDPVPGQLIHYTLDVSSLAATIDFTATIDLPNELGYLDASTFGGAIYLSNTQQIQWNATLAPSRSLRAGFDAVTFAPFNTSITVTAHITDNNQQLYSANTLIAVRNGSSLDVKLFGNAPAIRSGDSITYQLLVHNRSISNTIFALTTTLPGEVEFVRNVFSATTIYSDNLRSILWQRPLKTDRSGLAAIVISATRLLSESIDFITNASADNGSIAAVSTKLMLDPTSDVYLPIIFREFAASDQSYQLAPNNHPFGRMGSPPGSVNNLIGAGICQVCHNVAGSSIYAAWSTSAHNYSAIDPVFKAALHNASRQVKDVERWCTQCHQPANWLAGHPISQLDSSAVICSICHRAVDPNSIDSTDQNAINRIRSMSLIPPRSTEIGGNGALIIDPNDVRRGTNFLNPSAPHQTAMSAYQGSSTLCGGCHSVYAPHLARDEATGEFVSGTPDIAHGENPLFLQSTFPEWLNSQYATNDTQCQDCHMPMSPGYVAEPDAGGQPRDVPNHQFAGGNLFILDIFDQIGGLGDTTQQRAAVTAMLTQAATMTLSISNTILSVDVTCLAGHKCPTGYEEGRAWILQVEQLDDTDQRVSCSGCWDEVNHTISGYGTQPIDPDYDPELTEFSIQMGVTGTQALWLGKAPGESFDIALNNVVLSDTRIPPCGWDLTAYTALGIAPTVPYTSGSCTATAHYQIKSGTHEIVVRLLHWSNTTPYLQFLRDFGGDAGETLWSAWQAALAIGQGKPIAIVSQSIAVEP